MKRWWWVIPAGAVAALLLVVLYRAFGTDPRAVPFQLKGQTAPDFEMKVINGEGAMTLESLRGRPVVMNFWASWCGPCAIEHPILEWGARSMGHRVQFVGVVFEDTEANARAWLARHGASFPHLLDERGQVAVDFGASGVPETYFISADGTIVDKHVGPISQMDLVHRVDQLTGG
ncbi:MAG TPA: redoxin domain-containing protein [Myxococcaceae bacterium]|nr:redoxin domain-containing protein [Myxococcaceae bacterium]